MTQISVWTEAQAKSLNRWQQSRQTAPYTCPQFHLIPTVLVASVNGWTCPGVECNYTSTGIPQRFVVPGELTSTGIWTKPKEQPEK